MSAWAIGLGLLIFGIGLLVLAVGSYCVATKYGEFEEEPMKRRHARSDHPRVIRDADPRDEDRGRS